MKIRISDDAMQWFVEEMDVKTGDFIKFFARYGGSSPHQPGFSLGLRREKPDEIEYRAERDGVLFYVEKRDAWFFDGYDLLVQHNPELDEVEYVYEKA